MSDLTEALADEVRRLLDERGIRQHHVAAALGVTQSAVSDRLRGRTPFTLQDLERLRELLGMEPWELLYPKSAGPLVTTLDGQLREAS